MCARAIESEAKKLCFFIHCRYVRPSLMIHEYVFHNIHTSKSTVDHSNHQKMGNDVQTQQENPFHSRSLSLRFFCCCCLFSFSFNLFPFLFCRSLPLFVNGYVFFLVTVQLFTVHESCKMTKLNVTCFHVSSSMLKKLGFSVEYDLCSSHITRSIP